VVPPYALSFIKTLLKITGAPDSFSRTVPLIVPLWLIATEHKRKVKIEVKRMLVAFFISELKSWFL
jgi:hypothetical protein